MKIVKLLIVVFCMNASMKASEQNQERPLSPASRQVKSAFIEMINNAVSRSDHAYYDTISCDNDSSFLYNPRERSGLKDLSDFTKLMALTAEKMIDVKNEEEKEQLLLNMIDISKSLGLHQCLKLRFE